MNPYKIFESTDWAGDKLAVVSETGWDQGPCLDFELDGSAEAFVELPRHKVVALYHALGVWLDTTNN